MTVIFRLQTYAANTSSALERKPIKNAVRAGKRDSVCANSQLYTMPKSPIDTPVMEATAPYRSISMI